MAVLPLMMGMMTDALAMDLYLSNVGVNRNPSIAYQLMPINCINGIS